MRQGLALYSCTLPLIQHFLGSKWKWVEVISSRSRLLHMPWWGWLIRSNYGLSSTAEWTTSFQLMSSSSGQGGPHLWHYNRHTMRINFSYSENNYAVLGPGFGDILQLGSNNSERSYMLKWYRFVCPCVCVCPKRFFCFFSLCSLFMWLW